MPGPATHQATPHPPTGSPSRARPQFVVINSLSPPTTTQHDDSPPATFNSPAKPTTAQSRASHHRPTPFAPQSSSAAAAFAGPTTVTGRRLPLLPPTTTNPADRRRIREGNDTTIADSNTPGKHVRAPYHDSRATVAQTHTSNIIMHNKRQRPLHFLDSSPSSSSPSPPSQKHLPEGGAPFTPSRKLLTAAPPADDGTQQGVPRDASSSSTAPAAAAASSSSSQQQNRPDDLRVFSYNTNGIDAGKVLLVLAKCPNFDVYAFQETHGGHVVINDSFFSKHFYVLSQDGVQGLRARGGVLTLVRKCHQVKWLQPRHRLPNSRYVDFTVCEIQRAGCNPVVFANIYAAPTDLSSGLAMTADATKNWLNSFFTTFPTVQCVVGDLNCRHYEWEKHHTWLRDYNAKEVYRGNALLDAVTARGFCVPQAPEGGTYGVNRETESIKSSPDVAFCKLDDMVISSICRDDNFPSKDHMPLRVSFNTPLCNEVKSSQPRASFTPHPCPDLKEASEQQVDVLAAELKCKLPVETLYKRENKRNPMSLSCLEEWLVSAIQTASKESRLPCHHRGFNNKSSKDNDHNPFHIPKAAERHHKDARKDFAEAEECGNEAAKFLTKANANRAMLHGRKNNTDTEARISHFQGEASKKLDERDKCREKALLEFKEVRRLVKEDVAKTVNKVSFNSTEAWDRVTSALDPRRHMTRTPTIHSPSAFNRFFAQKNKRSKRPKLPSNVAKPRGHVPITDAEFDSALKIAKEQGSHAPDDDGISIDFITHPKILPILRPFLLTLFNRVLKDGAVPLKWREATIIPVLKNENGDVNNLEHYRGISTTSIFCRIFERIWMQRILTSTLEIDPRQLAFARGFGVDDALFQLQTMVADGFGYGSRLKKGGEKVKLANLKTLAFFPDMKDAYCRVSVNDVIEGYRAMNGPPEFEQLLIDYMSKRKQRVRVGNNVSDFIELDLGVPQGGVMSGLLYIFATYTLRQTIDAELKKQCEGDVECNGINVPVVGPVQKTKQLKREDPGFKSFNEGGKQGQHGPDDAFQIDKSHFHGSVHYADDSAITMTGGFVPAMIAAMNKVIAAMAKWCSDREFRLSHQKCKAQLFVGDLGKFKVNDWYNKISPLEIPLPQEDNAKVDEHQSAPPPPPPHLINITTNEPTKWLGILLDSQLNGVAQAEHLVETLRPVIESIATLRRFLSPNMLRSIVFSLVISKIAYAGHTLGLAQTKDDSSRVHVLLRTLFLSAARVVAGSVPLSAQIEDVLLAAKMLPLEFYMKQPAFRLFGKYIALPDAHPLKRLMLRDRSDPECKFMPRDGDMSVYTSDKLCSDGIAIPIPTARDVIPAEYRKRAKEDGTVVKSLHSLDSRIYTVSDTVAASRVSIETAPAPEKNSNNKKKQQERVKEDSDNSKQQKQQKQLEEENEVGPEPETEEAKKQRKLSHNNVVWNVIKPNDLVLIVDASKDQDGKNARYAFAFGTKEQHAQNPFELTSVRCSIGANHSSHSAEQYAILRGIEHVNTQLPRLAGNAKVWLLSDSNSNLSSLECRGACFPKDVVSQSIWHGLMSSAQPFNVRFVYAHCDFEPHDHVDRLASVNAPSDVSTMPDLTDDTRCPPHGKAIAARLRKDLADKLKAKLHDACKSKNYSISARFGAHPDKVQEKILWKLYPTSFRNINCARVGVSHLAGGCLAGVTEPCPAGCGRTLDRRAIGDDNPVEHLFKCPSNADLRVKAYVKKKAKKAAEPKLNDVEVTPTALWERVYETAKYLNMISKQRWEKQKAEEQQKTAENAAPAAAVPAEAAAATAVARKKKGRS